MRKVIINMNYVNIIKVNIIKIDLKTIADLISKYQEQFNINPVIICSYGTKNAIAAYKYSDIIFANTYDETIINGCKILIDNSLDFGIIEIR